MSFLFNLNRSDEQFIDKVRSSKKREMHIARLEVSRAWVSWCLLVVVICSTVAFAIECTRSPFTFQTFASALRAAFVSPSLALFVFVLLDMQTKSLKLAQSYEHDQTP